MQYLHLTEQTNNDDGVEKNFCFIIIRKRNTTNVFLTGFEFPHLCEAEDMTISATIKGRFLHLVLTPILFIAFVLNLMKYTC